MNQDLYEKVLNNFNALVYVLDDKGNYIYANDAYLNMLRMRRDELIGFNVHSFLKNGTINFCVSDKVYSDKKQVIRFQDISMEHTNEPVQRFLIISTPILDSEGNVANIFATMQSVTSLNDAYHRASLTEVSSIEVSDPLGDTPTDIIAESDIMRGVLSMVKNVANVDSSVLIQGESGTGKEVIASYLHNSSNRSKGPFVTINCASLPENLLESELFGYEKGAFTGAVTPKKGLFQKANKGTLFLDEINSMPLGLQGKLLRAIETKKIQPVGSTELIDVDFRLVAATNENLYSLCEEHRFRVDLYYRLNVIPVNLPPLRQHKEDIVPLALSFLRSYCERFHKNLSFTAASFEALVRYDWPGNIRELKNYIERAVILTSGDYIDIDRVNTETDFSSIHQNSMFPISPVTQEEKKENTFAKFISEGVSLEAYIEQCEKDYLEYALSQSTSTYKVAEMLNTSQSLIMRRKKKYSL